MDSVGLDHLLHSESALFLCLYNISLGWYYWKRLVKNEGGEGGGGWKKRSKQGGMAILGAGGGVYRRRYSNFLHTMIYGLAFPFCASIFRWTQLILPMTFGSKLFPFSHYILQIGIYISNVPQGYFGASFQVFDLPVPNIMGTDL